MNIFFLDLNTTLCAQYHIDKHTTKMLTEYAQIMSTFHWLADPVYAKKNNLYRPTHKNHPSVQWAGLNITNYQWLYFLWGDLHREYQYRYGESKVHGAFRHWAALSEYPTNILDIQYTPVGMAQRYQAVGPYKRLDSVEAYRDYYRQTKRFDKNGKDMAVWSGRGKPEWW